MNEQLPAERTEIRGIYDMVRGQRRDVDHGHGAALRLGMDRVADARARGTDC
jgi:hypothetical protein